MRLTTEQLREWLDRPCPPREPEPVDERPWEEFELERVRCDWVRDEQMEAGHG